MTMGRIGGALSIYSIINESVNPTYDNQSKHLNTEQVTFFVLFVDKVNSLFSFVSFYLNTVDEMSVIMLRFRYLILGLRDDHLELDSISV